MKAAIGIDPSLTRTGIALVLATAQIAQYRCVLHAGLEPGAPHEGMLRRWNTLADDLSEALTTMVEWAQANAYQVDRIVIEDVTDTSTAHRHGSHVNRTSDTKLGASFGLALAVARRQHDLPIMLAPPGLWMPKAGKNLARRNYTMEMIRSSVAGLPPRPIDRKHTTNDDVIMAAGLARWWLENERLPPLLRAAPCR